MVFQKLSVLSSKATNTLQGFAALEFIMVAGDSPLRTKELSCQERKEEVAMTAPADVPMYRVQFHSVAFTTPLHRFWQ